MKRHFDHMLALSMFSLVSIMLILSTISTSYQFIFLVNASSNDLFCYDQIGDGHHCFEREKKCQQVQKHDQIAESPCYLSK